MKNKHKVIVGTLVSCSTLLFGCFEKEPKEEVKTVEWYLKNTKQQEEMVARCANNPGELSETPNCINANAAMLKASSGTPREIKWN
ncbi:MAG: EexN family lipoprotein [Pseudomonadota bacterium]